MQSRFAWLVFAMWEAILDWDKPSAIRLTSRPMMIAKMIQAEADFLLSVDVD